MALRRAAIAALVAVACALAPAAGADEPINSPVTVPVPDGATAAQVLRAIRAALIKRTWQPGKEKDGFIVARLVRPKVYWCRIGVAYDYRQVEIRYLDSEGLDYDPEDHTIDSGYNKWMRFLTKDIGTNLELTAGLQPSAPESHPEVPAPAPAVAVVPVPPAPPTQLRAGAQMHAQARLASPVTGQNAELASVSPKGPMRNAEGTWWYVTTGGISGWVLQSDLQ